MSFAKNEYERDKINDNISVIDTNSNDLLCDVKSDTITNVNNKIDETRTKLYVNNNNTKRSFINNLNKKKRSDKSGGFKNIVHKVMSWNSRTSNKDKPNAINESADTVTNLKNLKLQQDDSDENICKADWLRARDSLENLMLNRELNPTDLVSSKSASMPFRKTKETTEEKDDHNPKMKNHKNASAHSISKVLAWDPWDKLGKKTKKENKRRKEKLLKETTSYKCEDKRKDVTSGDEIREFNGQNSVDGNNTEENYENYQYRPYHKNVKSVDFTNEVRVVYFNAEEVVGESKEPLKKELEQQIRNKEMRRGHCPTMMIDGW